MLEETIESEAAAVLLFFLLQCSKYIVPYKLLHRISNWRSTEIFLENIWKNAQPSELMDSKLRVVFEQPSESEPVTEKGTSRTPSAPKSPVAGDSQVSEVLSFCYRVLYIRLIFFGCALHCLFYANSSAFMAICLA